MRTPVLAANWKMHKTVAEATAFTAIFLPKVADVTDAEIVLAPPLTALTAVTVACRSTRVAAAAQNVYWKRHGAFTGEVSAAMLQDAGASYVIIGHSERRQFFREDDTIVNRKLRASIDVGLIPIVCIGETLDQREAHETHTVLARQVGSGLNGLTTAEVGALIIAYEPVWAIGTGRTATPDQAQDAHYHIRECLSAATSAEAASRCRLIYGGSVKPENASALSAQPDVDGALVGGASLDPQSFAAIVAHSRPGQ